MDGSTRLRSEKFFIPRMLRIVFHVLLILDDFGPPDFADSTSTSLTGELVAEMVADSSRSSITRQAFTVDRVFLMKSVRDMRVDMLAMCRSVLSRRIE